MKAIHATGYMIDQVSNQGFVKQTQARMRVRARTYTHTSKSNNLEIAWYIAEREKKELLHKLLEWMTGQGYVVDSVVRRMRNQAH